MFYRIVRDVLWIYYQRKQRLKKIKVNVKISKRIKLKRINKNKQKINLVYKRQKNKRKRRDQIKIRKLIIQNSKTKKTKDHNQALRFFLKIKMNKLY